MTEQTTRLVLPSHIEAVADAAAAVTGFVQNCGVGEEVAFGIDMAVREAIEKGLEKAHKNIVHLATITNVKDNNRLLVVKEHIAKMDGVYHVRQISFDTATHVAELEIIASPKAHEFWRAWLEKLPLTIVTEVKTLAPRKPRPASAPPASYPPWYK